MVNAIVRTYIPGDWSVITLGNYAQIFRGGSPRPIQAFLTTSDQGVNWIKIGDVSEEDKFIKSTEEKIVPEGVSYSRMVFRGDLILSNSMSYGRPYIMNIEGCIHDGWLVIQKYDRVFDRDYLYYALSSGLTMKQYVAMAAGSSVQNLNKKKVSKVVLPCPRISEQKSIAEVLSDIDTLIIDLKKLIRKKKDICQGTMQMLLSGKHRLDGYSSSWRTSELSKVTSRIGVGLATSVTQYYRGSGTIIFRNLNIKENYLDDTDVLYLEEEFASRNSNKAIHKGDVLTVHTGYVGISCVVPEKYDGALTFTTLITTTNKKELLPEYLSYHLNSSLGHRVIENLQTSGGRKNLNVSDFEKYTLTFPKDINEQRAIVSVLADMDVEIRKFEEKLSKYQKLKQGMMEELLTGKVRLM